MSRTVRQIAMFALVAICLATCASSVQAQESEAAKEKNSEPRHELLYKTINFAILVGALAYVLRKPLAEFLSSRSASIQKSLEEGRRALEASQTQLQAVEEKLRRLESEIAAFKASAVTEMEAERLRLEQASAEEGNRILESARVQMDAALRGAKLDLKNYTAQKAVTLAEELIRARLDDAGRQRLVAQFAATLEAKDRKN